jgi:predicted molibdopterin-dependent oxidoreductase YjgC
MGSSLPESSCESCGLCISTCPTGAITENVPFKPGPVIADKHQSICNYCSVGCTVEIQHKGCFITGVNGRKGVVNKDGNICRLPKFGYRNRNTIQRITKPLLKVNGKFSEISFEKAFDIIVQNIRSVKPTENAFFGGARLTNEELYLIHKLARGGAGTNNIGSFQYLGRGEGYRQNTRLNVPFSQIPEASAFFIFGSALSQDHPVISYMVQNRHYTAKTPVYVVSTDRLLPQSKVDEQIRVDSYYYFLKAVNFYMLKHGLENQLFIKDRTVGFEEYQQSVLNEDFPGLVASSGTTEDVIAHFAELFNTEINAILIFSEKNTSANSSKEIRNLAMLTGKLGKTASGIIALRESCNSQGVFDMGISPHSGIGGQSLADEQYLNKISDRWVVAATPPDKADCFWSTLTEGSLRNLFIFGEDPLGCASDQDFMERTLAGRKFLMVQDYFMTETASQADLVLPASFPDELGGTFTNAQKTIQEIKPRKVQAPAMDSLSQIATMVKQLGLNCSSDPNQVFMEIVPLLPEYRQDDVEKWLFTTGDNDNRHFNYGCDAWVKLFTETLEQPLN